MTRQAALHRRICIHIITLIQWQTDTLIYHYAMHMLTMQFSLFHHVRYQNHKINKDKFILCTNPCIIRCLKVQTCCNIESKHNAIFLNYQKILFFVIAQQSELNTLGDDTVHRTVLTDI